MSEIVSAIKQICEEKGLSYDAVIATIESALAAAYRKDYGEKNQNIKVEYNPETNGTKVFDAKLVVEDLPAGTEIGEDTITITNEEGEELRKFNPKNDIQLKDALEIKDNVELGEELRFELPTKEEYGRMAAQTAKQVIIQRLREAERDMVFEEFKSKEHEVLTGVVQRREGRLVLVDIGKTTGVIFPDDQVRGEVYRTGNRIKVYVKEVRLSSKGPEILLSRSSDEILRKVFQMEIPEVASGLVELKAVAREAGSRAKVAVLATAENIDPIGSCVGQRGARIQTIIRELGGEKIDIIEYSDDLATFIANSLAPAKVESVDVNKDARTAFVKVAEDQLSLAIGKSGQNVRLAARLTNWKLDITDLGGKVEVSSDDEASIAAAESKVESPKSESGDVEMEEVVAPEAEVEVASTEEKPKKVKKVKKIKE
ncbi:MAG TPA: transcription termination factor NusA [bacterium]|nr:transcription termination factor NusA [bacterium]